MSSKRKTKAVKEPSSLETYISLRDKDEDEFTQMGNSKAGALNTLLYLLYQDLKQQFENEEAEEEPKPKRNTKKKKVEEKEEEQFPLT